MDCSLNVLPASWTPGFVSSGFLLMMYKQLILGSIAVKYTHPHTHTHTHTHTQIHTENYKI